MAYSTLTIHSQRWQMCFELVRNNWIWLMYFQKNNSFEVGIKSSSHAKYIEYTIKKWGFIGKTHILYRRNLCNSYLLVIIINF